MREQPERDESGKGIYNIIKKEKKKNREQQTPKRKYVQKL
jgi:hypothetical protein